MEHSPILCLASNPGPMTGGNQYLAVGRSRAGAHRRGRGHPDHVRAVGQHLQGRRLARVLVTHGHVDHASESHACDASGPISRRTMGPAERAGMASASRTSRPSVPAIANCASSIARPRAGPCLLPRRGHGRSVRRRHGHRRHDRHDPRGDGGDLIAYLRSSNGSPRWHRCGSSPAMGKSSNGRSN
jgi:glyoxylase-like metal-dependent hydrolase (beta-lactamase superfamily II)